MTDSHHGPPTEAATRRRVAVAGHAGDRATATSHLDHADPRVRCSALTALARMGALGADDVCAALTDPDPTVRRRAAQLAAGAGGTSGSDAADELERPATTVALVAALGDADERVAEMAAFALGERHPGPHGPQVVAALSEVTISHDDHLCREAAVAALGALQRPEGLDAVLAACGDRANVRRRAVIALAAFDGPRVNEALRGLAGDRDLQVRQAAEDLLAIDEGEPT